MNNLRYIVYLSQGKELALDVIQSFFPRYQVLQQDSDEIYLKPHGFKGSEHILCQIIKRKENESADVFSDGLMNAFEQGKRHPKDRAWLSAQMYYSNTKVVFSVSNEISQFTRYGHVGCIKALCENLQGIMLDNDNQAIATAFINNNGWINVYSGVLCELGKQEKKASAKHPPEEDTLKAHVRIAPETFSAYPHHSEAFDEVFRIQQVLAEKNASIAPIQKAKAAFYDGAYNMTVRLLESILPETRSAEEAAFLGMAYHAKSYFSPNNTAGRKKAVDTIMAVDGEGNADWHYALSYVLHVSDPASSVKHLEKVLSLGETCYSAYELKAKIENRLEQIKRDRRIRDEVVKNNAHKTSHSPFKDFDGSSFWNDSEYALENYVSPVASDAEFTERAEEAYALTGYKLPLSYLKFMRMHNGGKPNRSFHKTESPTIWSDEGVAIEGFYAIGEDRTYSLLSGFGSRFRIEDWNYPDIGVYIADTPTAGHDMIALDYRFCGPEGEPAVVHVAQEDWFAITFIAKDFETFINGLETPEDED